MTMKLEGKVAVITGGSAGIGLGTAKRFATEGARVFITGRREAQLAQALVDIGGTATAVRGDSSNLADLDHIYRAVREQAGRIDILFVNAGFYEFSELAEATEQHFDSTFDTNVRGAFFAVQKALPLLSAGASVILNGSIASMKGIPAFSVYNATKAALRSFARSWILELKGRNIRVNVLSPGHTETPGLDNLLSDEQRAGLRTLVPLDRLGTADDVARAAVFLASEDSAYITGTEMFVDGGVAQY